MLSDVVSWCTSNRPTPDPPNPTNPPNPPGDSGGGIFGLTDGLPAATPLSPGPLIGVTSFGYGCAQPGQAPAPVRMPRQHAQAACPGSMPSHTNERSG